MKKVNVLIPITLYIPEKCDEFKDDARLCSTTKEYQRCLLMHCGHCAYDYFDEGEEK